MFIEDNDSGLWIPIEKCIFTTEPKGAFKWVPARMLAVHRGYEWSSNWSIGLYATIIGDFELSHEAEPDGTRPEVAKKLENNCDAERAWQSDPYCDCGESIYDFGYEDYEAEECVYFYSLKEKRHYLAQFTMYVDQKGITSSIGEAICRRKLKDEIDNFQKTCLRIIRGALEVKEEGVSKISNYTRHISLTEPTTDEKRETIDNWELNPRTKTALYEADILTMKDLEQYYDCGFDKINGIGKRSVGQLSDEYFRHVLGG